MVQSQPRQKFTSPYLEQALHKKRVGGAAQGVGLEFKSQYRKKKKEFALSFRSTEHRLLEALLSLPLSNLERQP
jgi:hypothetical protein